MIARPKEQAATWAEARAGTEAAAAKQIQPDLEVTRACVFHHAAGNACSAASEARSEAN